MSGFSEYEVQVRRRITELEHENALQADVIEGFLTGRVGFRVDLPRCCLQLKVQISHEELIHRRLLPQSVGAMVTAQLNEYLKMPEAPPWLDQNEKSKTPS